MNTLMIQLIQNSLLTSAAVVLLIILTKMFRTKTSPGLRVICWLVVAAAFLLPVRPVLFTIPTGDLVPAISDLTILQEPETPYKYNEYITIQMLIDEGIWNYVEKDKPLTETQEKLTLTGNTPIKESINRSEDISSNTAILKQWQPELPPVHTMILYGWLLGILASLILITTGHFRFSRKITRHCKEITDMPTLNLLTEVQEQTEVKCIVSLRSSVLIKTPITLGLFRPIVLLPAGKIDEQELYFMLLHEILHIKRRDLWSKAFILLVTAIHWFNPAVYFLNRAIDIEIELACDAAVLLYTGEEKRKKYGETVFNVAKRNWKHTPLPKLTSAFNGNKKNVKHRIASIIERKNTRRWVVICCTFLMVLSLTIAGLAGCGKSNDLVSAKVDLTPTDELIIYVPEWEYFNPKFSEAMEAFERIYPNVDLVIQRIGTRTNSPSDRFQSRITTELMAGSGPDVIITDYFDDLYKTIETGVFLNLNEVLEQDEDFDLNDYHRVVMDAGVYKSGRYIMPITFTAPIVLTEQKSLKNIGFDITKNTNFTSFMNEAVASMPKAREIDPKGSIAYISRHSMDFNQDSWGHVYGLHYSLLNISAVKLVDFETGTALPDEETFRAMCEAYKPYYEYETTSVLEHQDIYELSINGAAYFWSRDYADHDYISWRLLMDMGYEPLFTGIYDMDGGLNATVSESVAIRAGSKNQLNAWNFIKLLISEDIQGNNRNAFYRGMVVNKAAFDRRVERSETSYGTVEFSSGSFFIPPVPEEKRHIFRDLVENITSCSFITRTLNNDFFLEYMEPYFKGEKTYEEAAEVLKQRLKFYISE